MQNNNHEEKKNTIVFPEAPNFELIRKTEEVHEYPKKGDDNSFLDRVQQRMWDWLVFRKELKELKKQMTVVTNTRVKMLEDRGKEGIDGFRDTLATIAHEQKLRLAEQLHRTTLDVKSQKIIAKQLAVNKLTNDTHKLISNINANLSEEYQEVIKSCAIALLKGGVEDIVATDPNLDEIIQKTYEKKSPWPSSFF